MIALKAVPGASRDQIIGLHGDRLKVRVAAAAEAGKANRAIIDLLARTLGVKPRDIEVVTGASSAQKTLRVRGVSAAEAMHRLGIVG